MSGTAPRGDQGPCETRACQRPFGHKGDHALRICERDGCDHPTRNAEEHFCKRHESRSTYELYEAIQ
jgi:hypothetical protein